MKCPNIGCNWNIDGECSTIPCEHIQQATSGKENCIGRDDCPQGKCDGKESACFVEDSTGNSEFNSQ